MIRRSGIFVLVLSVSVLLLLTACGGGANPIIGEWQATKPAMAFEFFQDGTVTWKQGGRTFTGQYKQLDKENIRLDMVGDLGPRAIVLENIKISGDTLTLTLDGQQIAFSLSSGSNSQSPAVGPQNAVTPQSTPGSQTNVDSTESLLGKWGTDFHGSTLIYILALDPDGRIKILEENSTPTGTYWDVQPVGKGKFSGYAVYTSLASGQESRRQALEIQMSGDGQRLDLRQANNEGKWSPATFVRFDETAPLVPTATP